MPFFPSILKNIRFQFFIVYNLSTPDRARAVAGVTRLLNEGRLQHNIGQRFPLGETAQAHELVESGKALGNVIIELPTA